MQCQWLFGVVLVGVDKRKRKTMVKHLTSLTGKAGERAKSPGVCFMLLLVTQTHPESGSWGGGRGMMAVEGRAAAHGRCWSTAISLGLYFVYLPTRHTVCEREGQNGPERLLSQL